MLRTLRDALIAIIVERSVNWLVPQFLPYAWLLILAWLTWDLLRTKPLQKLTASAYSRWGRRNPVWTYVIVFAAGGTLLSLYWAGITGVFASIKSPQQAPPSAKAEISTPPRLPDRPIQGPSPRFREKLDAFIVTYGGVKQRIGNINGNQVRLLTVNQGAFTGGGPVQEPRSDADEARIVVSVSDDQLLVDADVFTSTGQPPMRVRRNEISGRPLGGTWEHRGWDKQSTDNALEIVNENRSPVLQIIYLDNAQVVITGVFVSGERAVILTAEETVFALKSHLNEFLKRWEINRLFKYPSWQYPGELEAH
jgi:hypothetical protein